MNSYGMFTAAGIVITGELLVHLLLFGVSKWFGKSNRDKVSVRSVFKGILERSFIVISLSQSLGQALILLGALKIATRIKDNEDRVSNDFFLVGNLLSVLFGLFYFIILTR